MSESGGGMSWRFVTCAALFITCLLTANIIAAKLVVIGGVVLPAGIVIFPISYILADVLTEVWGYGAARRVIWLGFACNTLMVAATWVGGARVPAHVIAGQWGAKVLYEAAATPLTYAVVGWLKSRERVDTFDYQTDFNPIRL